VDYEILRACCLNLCTDRILSSRSKSSLAAENLFLRKQLAFCRTFRMTASTRSPASDTVVGPRASLVSSSLREPDPSLSKTPRAMA
jgi:hypothetical protein